MLIEKVQVTEYTENVKCDETQKWLNSLEYFAGSGKCIGKEIYKYIDEKKKYR